MPDEGQQEPGVRIRPQPIEEEMQRSYIDYAMSVIVGRALPDARDGLKPVQRRILHAMNELGMSSGSQFKKAARVVGECFVKGTLVATERGLVPIEEVARGDRVFTETGVRRVIELYRMPPRSVVNVELENGIRAKATRSQEFRVVRRDLSFAWKTAMELEPGDWVALRSAFPTFLSDLPKLPPFEGREMRLGRGLAYLLGQLMSDGRVSNGGKRSRTGFASVDRRVMERIRKIIEDEFGYRPTIETREPSNPNYKRMHSVRINRDSINGYLTRTFELRGIRAATKFIPGLILQSPRSVVLAFLSGLIDGDGSVARSRRVIHYGSVSESLIEDLHVLLHHLGFHAKRYLTEPNPSRFSKVNGRRVVARQTFHALEVAGAEAWALAQELELANARKRGRLRRLRTGGRALPQGSDILPFGSGVVFSELSKAHLGSGWFVDVSGRRFRQGIVHPSGTKIRYSSRLQSLPLHMQQVREWGILEKLERIGSPLVTDLNRVLDAGLSFARVSSVQPAGRKRTYDLGVEGDHNFVANGIVVHNCLGKYHPHGDTAVYDALARMVQDFSLRYPLIQGQGNWGSTEDEPAAMRYTECRLSKVAEELLQDIEKDTVEWGDNFDGTLKEPLVLPGKFPNLLVNGSSGIAVGMATNMPPHNLGEIVDGLILLIDNPNASLSDLYNPETGPIRGPDFPTGGVLNGVAGVTEAYSTGRGLISLRAKAGFEDAKGDKIRIVITEIPYFVNKGTLVESIALLVKQKRIEGVTDLRDESDREGMRIVLELKRDAVEDVVLNQLYHHTQMDSTFGIINLALVDGRPKVLPLKEMLQSFVEYRVEVVRKRTQFDLNKARQREHIVEGLLTAIDHLDDVIRIVRRARDPDDAAGQLRTRYLLSEDQAKAILDMSLRKLTGLETQALRTEQDQLKKAILDLEAILASKERVLEIIKNELRELKEKYGDERRTAIEVHASEMEVEDLIPEEDNVVTITNTGYVKRLPVSVYRKQRRGGKGVTGMETKEEDFVVDLFVASTHDYILFFTSKGKVFKLKAFRVPSAGRYAKGKPVVNLLERLDPGEKVEAMIPTREFPEDRFLIFVTKRGRIKRTSLAEFQNIRVSGIRAIKLNEGDELIDVHIADGREEVVLASAGGYANRFSMDDVRPMGRPAAGVAGMRVGSTDEVVSMALSKEPQAELLTVLSSGYGKRTTIAEYRKTRRGSKGVRTTSAKYAKGRVVTVKVVEPEEHLLVTTKVGIVIRCPVADISMKGRAARGVRLQRLQDGDEVVAVARVIEEEEQDRALNSETPPNP
jgi:DNA gyrase subunit A